MKIQGFHFYSSKFLTVIITSFASFFPEAKVNIQSAPIHGIYIVPYRTLMPSFYLKEYIVMKINGYNFILTSITKQWRDDVMIIAKTRLYQVAQNQSEWKNIWKSEWPPFSSDD